ncbi:putative F-box/LRR-repeat protein 23 [Rosa rugosa]|uniref:putative F-box/LRR-repeat protein 23 n=1 Tax=Rosa rugosa TaxID=74645 RepID=UPI002B40186A|nr:putative F-box/LRR-repeat protein 23 [Rosa rugosa]
MLNKQNLRLSLTTRDDLRESLRTCDEEALAISRTMQDLHHLKLIGNRPTNDGLRKIIDSCTNLESLDLRCCYHLNLAEDLGRCAEQIKSLRLPNDSVDDMDYLSSTTVNCHIAPYKDDYSDFDEEEDDDSEFDDEEDYIDIKALID